jgi:hypothetical protein
MILKELDEVLALEHDRVSCREHVASNRKLAVNRGPGIS